MTGPAPVQGLQVLHFERNPQDRDCVVGDVHGCFTALQTSIDSINFSPATFRISAARTGYELDGG